MSCQDCNPTPNYTIDEELVIMRRVVQRNERGDERGATEPSVLRVPMPRPEISYDAYGRRETEDKPCLIASQVEEFLMGLGVKLPSRRVASEQIHDNKKLREQGVKLDGQLREREKAIDSLVRERTMLRAYVRGLEQRMREAGVRIPKKLRDSRPELPDLMAGEFDNGDTIKQAS